MTRETRETPDPYPRNPTRKTWGKGLTGTGTGWPGIPQGYPWYSLSGDVGNLGKSANGLLGNLHTILNSSGSVVATFL